MAPHASAAAEAQTISQARSGTGVVPHFIRMDFAYATRSVLYALAVVMAARGYPEAPERGSIIRGLDRAAAVPNVTIFHAGTTQDVDGTIRAAGGRVLTICATGPTIEAARDSAYTAVGKIDWPEGFCRSDIGWRALARA